MENKMLIDKNKLEIICGILALAELMIDIENQPPQFMPNEVLPQIHDAKKMVENELDF
jgi:hypothetical protein